MVDVGINIFVFVILIIFYLKGYDVVYYVIFIRVRLSL